MLAHKSSPIVSDVRGLLVQWGLLRVGQLATSFYRLHCDKHQELFYSPGECVTDENICLKNHVSCEGRVLYIMVVYSVVEPPLDKASLQGGC